MNLRLGLGLFIVSCHLVVKMRSTVLATVALSGFVLTLADGKGKGKGKGNDRIRTIYKDVAIIGGGASGSYSAVRLMEDYNVSVVVIEKNFNLVSFIVLDSLTALTRSLPYLREDMSTHSLIL